MSNIDLMLEAFETREQCRIGSCRPNFTGIDSPYERPENPDIRIDTTRITPEQACALIMDAIRERL